jgi:hypothetical protein
VPPWWVFLLAMIISGLCALVVGFIVATIWEEEAR